MKRMGQYCKAYEVNRFRESAGWSEDGQNRERKPPGANEESEHTGILNDDDVLYLQENYTVTDDIFIDEHVVFDTITPEWQDFCRTVLLFEPVQTGA